MDTRLKSLIILTMICGSLLLLAISCKKDEDPFTVYDNGKTIIPNTTKVIDDSDFNSTLIIIDSSSYTITFKASNITDNISVGDIIVSGVGDGLLRKVTNISKSSDQVVIKSVSASFTDAFQKADLVFKATTTTKKSSLDKCEIEYLYAGVKIDTLGKGSNLSNGLLNNVSFDITLDGDNREETIDDQVQLSGTFSLDKELDGNIKIDNSQLQKLYLKYVLTEKLDLSASCPLAEINLNKEILFAKIKYPRITCTLGPVPVIVRPILTLYFGVEFDVSSEIETEVSQEFTISTGVTWESGGWTKYAEPTHSFNFEPPTLNANAEAKAYIRPELEMKFYGSIAPNLSIPVYTKISAEPLDNPWWTLTSGLSGDIGINMSILDKQIIDYSTSLFDIPFTIAQANGGFPTTPVVVINNPSVVAQTSATISGEVISDGNVPLIACGVCWSTSQNPTLANEYTNDGNGIGGFTSQMQGLTPNTPYYVRAYAINSVGTAYSNTQINFTTSPIIEIPNYQGSLIENATPSIVEITYSLPLANIVPPTTAFSVMVNSVTRTISNVNVSGTKVLLTLSSPVVNGDVVTVAYTKPATNPLQTISGGMAISISAQQVTNNVKPNVPPEIIYDVDGNAYNTVSIGSQVWLKENLRTTKFNNGDIIPYIPEDADWYNYNIIGYGWYNNDAINYKNMYGGYYNGYTIIDTRNICPLGWHIPSYNEWVILVDFIGGESTANIKLKSVTGWTYPYLGGTDEYGFSAMPGGEWGPTYAAAGVVGRYWTSSNQVIDNSINTVVFGGSEPNIVYGNDNIKYGHNVRCVRD